MFKGRFLSPLAALIAAAALLPTGCAYYNVLYNANLKYKEAQTIKTQALLATPEREKIGQQEENLYKEAFDKAARVVKVYPKSKHVDDALLLMAVVSHEKGDFTTAIRKCDEILTLYPNSDLTGKVLLTKGSALIGTKEFEAARESLRKVADSGDDDIRDDVVYFLGVVEEKEGRIDEAKVSYATVVEKHNNSEYIARAGLALGRIQLEAGDLEAAIGSFERVRKKARLPEERFQGGLEKGKALLADKQYARARTTFDDLSKRAVNEKQRGEALLFRGRTLEAEGVRPSAFETYAQILEKMPRTEAAAEAQLAIAKAYDDDRDYLRAKEEYQKVNEQGTGFIAWRTASDRVKEIQRVLDLRSGIDNDDEKEEERQRKRFLLAEQLLEKLGDVDGALIEYSSLAKDASGTDLGARALFAEAWLFENRLARPDTAEALLYNLVRDYHGTEVDRSARRRFGLPVWNVAKTELAPARSVLPAGSTTESVDAIVNRAEPRVATLPEGTKEAKVWVRVAIGEDGTVTSAKVSKSAGEDVDAAALEAAQATTFLARSDGGPAVSVLEYFFPPRPKVEPPPTPPAPPASSAPPDSAAAPADSTWPGSSAPPDSAALVPPAFLDDNPEGEPLPMPGVMTPADSARARAGLRPPTLRDRDFDPSTGD